MTENSPITNEMAAETTRWSSGALLGLSVLILVEGFTDPPESLARKIALYCFVIAVPLLVYVLSSVDTMDFSGNSTTNQQGCIAGIDGLIGLIANILPIIGLGAWILYLSKMASLVFFAVALIVLVMSIWHPSSNETNSDG
jgi:hypothetical protein